VVELTLGIQEGPQSVVQEVVVSGNDHTSQSFVRSQIVLQPGDVLDYRRTARSRRNLYDTGAFTSVDLRTEPVEANGAAAARKPLRVIAEVRERTPFQFRYGAFFDTERGPGFIADFTNRNSLGSARLIGLRTRYDADVREARVYFSQPLLRRLPLKSDAAVFLRRELREAFITDRTGVTFQQEAHLTDQWLVTYGYRFERAHTFDRIFDPDAILPFDETLDIAPLTGSLSRDTRDEVLDATRGSFNSHSIELPTATLGSSLRFVRYFGQYFRYFGLTDPEPVPFRRNLEAPRVIFATGFRVGLARGLGGQEIIPSERFFAGGGTTVRGFKQDELGPRDFLDRPAGGNAMVVFNNELRFPLFRWFDGVSFIDIGNVYPLVSDISIGDLRKTGGVGLRLRTPYLLLRVDYGLKFDRRPGETRGAIFFSIGQAF
jgi:outer membrane protein assembly factor BamA